MKMMVTNDYNILSNIVACMRLFIAMTLASISNDETKGRIYGIN